MPETTPTENSEQQKNTAPANGRYGRLVPNQEALLRRRRSQSVPSIFFRPVYSGATEIGDPGSLPVCTHTTSQLVAKPRPRTFTDRLGTLLARRRPSTSSPPLEFRTASPRQT